MGIYKTTSRRHCYAITPWSLWRNYRFGRAGATRWRWGEGLENLPSGVQEGFHSEVRSLREFKHNGCSKKNSKQECIPVGCVPSAAVADCWGECLPMKGVYPRWCLPRRSAWAGVSAQGECLLSLTHACENITFPQLCLWMVISVRSRLISDTRLP